MHSAAVRGPVPIPLRGISARDACEGLSRDRHEAGRRACCRTGLAICLNRRVAVLPVAQVGSGAMRAALWGPATCAGLRDIGQ